LLRAIIFDFDGVIVNSEPLILELTQQMAAQEGWDLSAEEYYRDYLALDDRGIVERLFSSHGRQLEPRRRDELLQWKSAAYRKAIHNGLPAMPGAVEFVQGCRRAGYPLAIASGSLREGGACVGRPRSTFNEEVQCLASCGGGGFDTTDRVLTIEVELFWWFASMRVETERSQAGSGLNQRVGQRGRVDS